MSNQSHSPRLARYRVVSATPEEAAAGMWTTELDLDDSVSMNDAAERVLLLAFANHLFRDWTNDEPSMRIILVEPVDDACAPPQPGQEDVRR